MCRSYEHPTIFHLNESGGDEITNVGPIPWAYRMAKDRKTRH
jgi:hypothetical protein